MIILSYETKIFKQVFLRSPAGLGKNRTFQCSFTRNKGIKMKVELRLYASLSRETAGVKTGGLIVAEAEKGATIWEFLKKQEVPLEKVKMIFLNGKKVTGEEHLSEGDRLGVFPPVAGG